MRGEDRQRGREIPLAAGVGAAPNLDEFGREIRQSSAEVEAGASGGDERSAQGRGSRGPQGEGSGVMVEHGRSPMAGLQQSGTTPNANPAQQPYPPQHHNPTTQSFPQPFGGMQTHSPQQGSFPFAQQQQQRQAPQPVTTTLETFDLASFNPADPTAWTRLAEAWKASTGSEPSQMDIMGWVGMRMMGGGGGGGPSVEGSADQQFGGGHGGGF